jgi:hypothetical protein
MLKQKLILAAVLTASATMSLATVAEAHGRKHGHRHHHDHDDRRYYGERRGCRSSGTTGLIVGGAAGALLGREVDRYGDRTPGTVIGAGAGALLGRELDRKHRC